MELSHLLNLASELPQNSTLNYVRGTDVCKFINVDVIGRRINSEAPNGEAKSWAPSYLEDLAPKIKENIPFNLSGLLNNKGSFRPVLETIIAHTREFYSVRKGSAVALVWIPSKPKASLELEEIEQNQIPEPLPEIDKSNSLLPPAELADKVRESFIKFWQLIDQHGSDLHGYVRSFEDAVNPYLVKLDLGYDNIFQIVNFALYSAVISRIVNDYPEMAYINSGRHNNGTRYEVGSTHLHFSNYLQILANSDFRANIDFETASDDLHKALIDEPLQVIFYGAPGTGKSFTIDEIADDENSVRTTFHPDSDYASFVGAYKPTMENVPINSIYGDSVQFATGKNGHPGTEKKIVYKYVPQAFLKAYVAAWSNLTKPYFLIIEEINRGNCAQIFGDLFQLLDRNNAGSSSYAIHADEDISQFLSSDKKGFAALSDEQKEAIRAFELHKDNGKTQAVGQAILDGRLLLLPPNLYIWATMNTSDQSLFPIDSAFKRRWNWKYMPIEYHPIDKKTQRPIDWKFQIGDNIYSWGQFLAKINPEIYTLTESSDKQMGYFFAKADPKTGVISEEVFLNKVLFYLWTDVFKDYDVSSELFKNKKANRSFIFTDFFDKDYPEALEDFIANFRLDAIETGTESVENEENTANSENAAKRAYGRSLVIKFPDGTQIMGDTQFDSYIQALEKIGMDKAAAVIAKKGYSRHQVPLVSKEKSEIIESSPTFSYVQCGEYFVIKGIDTMEGTLKGISKELGLDLEVYFE